MAPQADSNAVFPAFAQINDTTSSWYVSVLDGGTSYNGTVVSWVKVTLQHTWLLGWYLGVCTDCGWSQFQRTPGSLPVVMMQSNVTDPRVQWMIFAADS